MLQFIRYCKRAQTSVNNNKNESKLESHTSLYHTKPEGRNHPAGHQLKKGYTLAWEMTKQVRVLVVQAQGS